MAKLLKGKRVFVDTTEFSAAHFNMQNPSFVEFAKLCGKRQMVLLTTDITKREIDAGVRFCAEKALQTIAEAAKVVDALQEPEVPAVKALAGKLTSAKFLGAWSKGVEDFFKECHAVTLAMPPNAASKVFDLYFGRQPPFGGKNKKAEFPDAFVLQALQAAIRPNDDSLYVISDDSDFEKACQGNPKLVHLKSLSRLLNLVHEHDIAVKQVRATIDKNFNVIKKKLEAILKSLPPGLRDAEGTVTLNSIRLDDVLDASCPAMAKRLR